MLPTSAESGLAGDARLVAAVVVVRSRWLGSSQGDLLELPERSSGSSAARVKNRIFWVLRLLPEVGSLVCCSSGGMEPSGRKLGVWRVRLDAWNGFLESMEEV